jgi:outer membrane protein OmpA-like peptidoglycan-associated protein
MALLLTSCVAKKKYTEAQNRISQLEQQNADCVAKTESLNSNISSLEQRNTELQGRYDSSMRVYSTQQTRMNDYTGYYEKQKTSADQMHTTLHSQLDDKIGASNIVLHNNKVYITLPEVTLFNSGSTSLSTKGKDIINTLAATISQNPDVEVFVATSATDPATGLAVADNNEMDNTSVSADVSSSNYNASAKSTYKKPAAKKSTSSYAAKTSTKTSNGTKYKSESTKKTMKSNYARKTTKPRSSSSSMAVARASTIVSILRQQGVQKAGIQVTDPVNRTSTTNRKYQVVVSPSMEGYHEMMGKGDLGTGMK